MYDCLTFNILENKRKKDTISHLKAHGYRSDPVKVWKASLETQEDPNAEDGTTEEEEEAGEGEGGPGAEPEKDDYNYLLSMSMWSMTREKKEELLKNRDAKVSVERFCGN